MANFLTRIISNIAGLYAAVFFVSGFSMTGDWRGYLLAGTALGLLNLIVRPVLKILSFPLIILTLGLFTLVINVAILWAITYIFPFVAFQDIIALLLATLVITFINTLVSKVT